MRTKISIFVWFFMIPCYCQNYIPLPDTNVIWSVNIDKYSIFGDTLINDMIYKKYFQTNGDSTFTFNKATYYAAVREDSSKRIWAIRDNSSVEKLQYDFSLEIGDTLTVFPIGDFAVWSGSIPIDINNIDSIFINDSYHKRYKLTNNYQIEEFWIEGIGSTLGIFNPGISNIGIVDIGYPELLCFEQDSTTTYFTSDSICYKRIWIGIESSKINSHGFRIYPNPSNSFIILQFERFRSNYSMEIFNTMGTLFKSYEILNNNMEIDITDLVSGVYIYHIKDGKRVIDTGKLLFYN